MLRRIWTDYVYSFRSPGCTLSFPPHVYYLHSSPFENGDLHRVNIYMHGLHIGDGGTVKPIFIVRMDLKVWKSCFIAGSRHQVATIAHEVVVAFVKSRVVGITTRYARGRIYGMKKLYVSSYFVHAKLWKKLVRVEKRDNVYKLTQSNISYAAF